MRRTIFACLLMVFVSTCTAINVSAVSSIAIIRTVQPYGFITSNGALSKVSAHELVEIQNLSSETLNMTGWSMKYQSATGTTIQTLRTISPVVGSQYTLLPGLSRDTFVSSTYAAAYSVVSGLTFNLSLSDTAGNVILMNALGQEIDKVGWRTGSNVNDRAEGDAVLLTSITSTMQRIAGDTDNNSIDFKVLSTTSDPGLMFGGLYDADDLCSNIVGIQEIPPEGLVAYDDGTCASPDRCSNIDGIQLDVPQYYERLEDGTCVEHDTCENIEGVQLVAPEGYEQKGLSCVLKFVAQTIFITELLPNPEGADAGHEYIELYNASETTVNLADYSLVMSGKTYRFPSEKLLPGLSYISFSDDDLDIVFPNTTGLEILLVAKDGTVTSIMPAYTKAPTGQSWNNFENKWEYSNQLTRGEENKRYLVTDDSDPATSSLAACAPNQYRSPETNRCRLLSTLTTTLVPCKEGQYRSEETNRCRSIAQTVAASLKPCNDDQFRNPATGRCKKIASTDDIVKPCDAGWERNAETNRCRKVKATSLPVAAFPVENVAATAGSVSMIITGAAVIAGATGYAVWEWRHELLASVRRLWKK